MRWAMNGGPGARVEAPRAEARGGRIPAMPAGSNAPLSPPLNSTNAVRTSTPFSGETARTEKGSRPAFPAAAAAPHGMGVGCGPRATDI